MSALIEMNTVNQQTISDHPGCTIIGFGGIFFRGGEGNSEGYRFPGWIRPEGKRAGDRNRLLNKFGDPPPGRTVPEPRPLGSGRLLGEKYANALEKLS